MCAQNGGKKRVGIERISIEMKNERQTAMRKGTGAGSGRKRCGEVNE